MSFYLIELCGPIFFITKKTSINCFCFFFSLTHSPCRTLHTHSRSNTSLKRDKHDVLSTELQTAEKRLELIKQVCQSTEKKISACLQLLPSGQLTNNNSLSERNLNQLNGTAHLISGGGSTALVGATSLNTSLSSNSEDLLIENLLEKKQKKLPEVQLHQTLQELSELFPPDCSILG